MLDWTIVIGLGNSSLGGAAASRRMSRVCRHSNWKKRQQKVVIPN